MYNIQILEYLSEVYDNELGETAIFDDIKELIEIFPQQRFGQIITNYICPDYRDQEPSEFTQQLMGKWFDISFDPFFEESQETYERLCKNEN